VCPPRVGSAQGNGAGGARASAGQAQLRAWVSRFCTPYLEALRFTLSTGTADCSSDWKLKREPGKPIFLTGSANLAAGLIRHGLVDEYRVWINPILLGAGSHLFKGGFDRLTLRLVEQRQLASGLLILRYRPRAPTDVRAAPREPDGRCGDRAGPGRCCAT